jgi:hypothetical protein
MLRTLVVRSLGQRLLRPTALAVRSLFIKTAETPNPRALKFSPDDRSVLGDGISPVEYTSASEAARMSPLAERLFDVEVGSGLALGVSRV